MHVRITNLCVLLLPNTYNRLIYINNQTYSLFFPVCLRPWRAVRIRYLPQLGDDQRPRTRGVDDEHGGHLRRQLHRVPAGHGVSRRRRVPGVRARDACPGRRGEQRLHAVLSGKFCEFYGRGGVRGLPIG